MERRLFMARRRAADQIDDPDYYVVSLSTLIIVYKGLVLPKYLADFYPDLADENMQSAICLFAGAVICSSGIRIFIDHGVLVLPK